MNNIHIGDIIIVKDFTRDPVKKSWEIEAMNLRMNHYAHFCDFPEEYIFKFFNFIKYQRKLKLEKIYEISNY